MLTEYVSCEIDIKIRTAEYVWWETGIRIRTIEYFSWEMDIKIRTAIAKKLFREKKNHSINEYSTSSAKKNLSYMLHLDHILGGAVGLFSSQGL